MLRWSDWASQQSRKDSGDKVHTHAAPGSITLPNAAWGKWGATAAGWGRRQSRWLRNADGFAVCAASANSILKRSAARLAEKAPNVMLYLELPEGLQGSKISFKRFKANIL
jgi:hypothetical protein